jgi:hypothetical protein
MKGIVFAEPQFHEVVSGEKTQTRRIVKPQPDFISENLGFAKKNNGEIILPKYAVGETLYLKEPYDRSYIPEIGDKYDNPFRTAIDPKCWETIYRYDGYIYAGAEWRNAILMPAKYARYFIKITGVRCERLQDISDEDCMREGVCTVKEMTNRDLSGFAYEGFNFSMRQSIGFSTAKNAFADLIDETYGKGTWDSNPYVWVYDFKLLKK